MGRTWEAVAAPFVLGAILLALAAELWLFLAHGRFNIDEGLHLGAGRLIYEAGLLPYRDFPFSQGPGGPFFYGALGAAFDWTLWTGRAASLCAGLVCFAAMLGFAYRATGLVAAGVVGLLLLIEHSALWMFTQVRTEPLAVTLATLAALAFAGRRDTLPRLALPLVLLALATAFRLTYAPVLVVALGVTAFELRGSPRRLAGVVAIAGAIGLAAAAPMLAFPAESFFHVFDAQSGRAARLGWDHLPPTARFWFFGQAETDYLAVFLLLPLAVAVLAGWPRRERAPRRTLAVLLIAAALVYLPHLWFRYGFFQYFENAALLAILAIGIAAGHVLRGSGSVARRTAVVALVVLAWGFEAGRVADTLRVWTDPDLPTVRRLAPLRADVARRVPEGCEMLTFQTHLAFELGCRVTRGLEYSYFSFFPEMASDEAARRGVLNRAALLAALDQHPPEFVALTHDDADRITGTPSDPDARAVIPGLEGYRPWQVLRLPVGPLLTFWNDVYVYARADVVTAAR